MPAVYHLFVTIPSGWPIIVPARFEEYKLMIERDHVYSHVHEGTAAECIDKQLGILGKLIMIPQQP